MARFWKPAHLQADSIIDEMMAEAEQQLVRTGPFMDNSELIIWVTIGAAILLVIAALAVLYGRSNRDPEDYARGRDLFEDDDEFDHQPADAIDVKDEFSSIRITREDDSDDTTTIAREPGPLMSSNGADFVDDEPLLDEPANVVPLRAAEPVREPLVAAQHVEEHDVPQEQVSQAAADYDYGSVTGAPLERSTPVADTGWTPAEGFTQQDMSFSGGSDDDVPYVAPFIRDYINAAEGRQSLRIDELRNDVRRQLNMMKDEQSSRLDLFLSSMDRKLENRPVASFGGDYDDGSSTRRRFEGLSTSIERITQSLERQGERLADLSQSFDSRMADVAPIRTDMRLLHEDVRGFKEDAEINAAAVSELRGKLETLQEDFGRLERNFLERAEADTSSVSMRLSEVVRGTLDDDAYELNAKLSNGHTADCVIYLKGGRSKVAIDGRFPIETFNRLPSRDSVRKNLPQAKAGEDEFRRTVLRAIFSCADRSIVQGETTDSAILFMPSEAAYTILHDRFPDLVRDSHRARVWLTSPSTLMGTLNLLHNVLPSGDDYSAPRGETLGSDFDDASEGPFYAGPQERVRSRGLSSEEAALERRLRQLREQEQAISDELERARGASQQSTRRYRQEPSVRRSEDDFETRLERFAFDLDEGRDIVDDEPRSAFRDDRDDDLR
ncbi:MAG: DNA recombination protein RmuC [Pseudomonadota bacterium]